ncbi:hypothetical protein A2870_03130 [Candidatus Curtissbacteria bacterium RIFCSPHIGHO2_01_FULL_41_11]|uniref:Uncharacterized protein n=1 Tax=Candidatus Curtissbacteria bacterium RIFCSPHIGHO2_01_FULL_41_11 TaxID=1797711 RepID=A0A1F5G753_9BACT|nr:MAG: hypothetical protein A2870_03130 [Candidatus Curtissbacteria bacterium RIFCSPHIGHO2_01_FULL_41_11]
MPVFNMMRIGTEEAQKNFDGRWGKYPMMYGFAGNDTFVWFHIVLGVVTWALVIAVLVALVRYLWKKGDHAK